MKKWISLFLLVIVMASCHKDPDMSDLDVDFVVYTYYDTNTDYDSFTTYFIPDSVLIIGSDKQPRYWTVGQTDRIIGAIVKEMDSRGYVRTMNKNEADLGFQSSYIENTGYFQEYYSDPYWWWGYPGYWGPGYWGDWGGWYYPYSPTFSYSVGSLLTEMVDLKTKLPRDAESKLMVLWTAYMGGLLSSSDQFNIELTERALKQAFVQSPYITKK